MITRRNAATIARRVEDWFASNARALPWRPQYDPYHVWVSEFMAQQTRMEVVVDYFPRFIAKFPSIEALARADEDHVVAAWSGLGYYRRARMLHRSAKDIVERFGGELPRDVTDLRSLHGFGPYTAGSVASIAFDARAALVDGNVTRLVSRLEAIGAPWRSRMLDKRAWQVAELLVGACASPRSLNQGLMELGARVCKPRKPECEVCPLTRNCSARKNDATAQYPLPAPRTKTIELDVPIWLISDKRGRLLFLRADGRLMRGMFRLPHGNDALFPGPLIIKEPGDEIASFTHSVTNRKIRFRIFTPSLPDAVADTRGEWKWIAPDELGNYPHPSWVRKAVELWAGAKGAE